MSRESPSDNLAANWYDAVIERASQANRATEWHRSRPDHPPVLIMWFPAGDTKKPVVVDEERAPFLMGVPLGRYIHVEGKQAILDPITGTLEAVLDETRNSYGQTIREILPRLPQAEKVDEQRILATADDAITPEVKTWRLSLIDPHGSIECEISPATRTMATISPGIHPSWRTDTLPITLKIRKVGLSDITEAVALLEEFSAALFFELDHQYGVLTALGRDRWPITRSRLAAQAVPAAMLVPRNRYSTDAASLYLYGRTVEAIPLLEYLAYYQTIEHYYPVYARREVLQRVRNTLRDPGFDIENDLHVGRIVSATSTSQFAREVDQLKLTISACVDESDIRDFIEAEVDRRQFLADRKGISGITALSLKDAGNPLVAQVATRIYDLRNRIVHAKDGGGSVGSRPLLPTGDEVHKLGHDIALCRFLAQKVLVANSRAAHW